MSRGITIAIVVAALAAANGCSRSGPPYSPEQALKTFRVPPGFRIELVAAEPQVVDPVAMTFDERGRLFVVEMGDYPLSKEPRGKIKLLEDRDGDGRFEYATVFVDNFTSLTASWHGKAEFSSLARLTFSFSWTAMEMDAPMCARSCSLALLRSIHSFA